MKRQTMKFLVGVVLVGVVSQVALCGVVFNDVDGAAGWVWREAESVTTSSGFNLTWDGNSSGYPTSGGANSAIYTLNKGDYGTYESVAIPIDMSNAYLYARAVGNYDDYSREISILQGGADGTRIGYYHNKSGGMRLQEPAALSTGFSAGYVTLTLKHSGEADYNITDGFFVTNAAISDNGLEVVDGYNIVQAPTFVDPLPVIATPAFTPTVSGAPAGATYWCNGVMDYWNFPLIDTAGTYELAVKDYQGRIISGVSFEYVPEPATLTLLLLSGIGVLRCKK